MSTFMDKMHALAKADKKAIVLPEGSDPRTLEAAQKILDAGFADLIVLGDEEAILDAAPGLSAAQIIDPAADPLADELAA